MAGATIPPGLTDSDILIDAQHAVADAVQCLADQHAGTGVRVSVISCMELVSGCRNAQELAKLQQFLQYTTIVPVSDAVSLRAYTLMQSWSLSHGLQVADALIAATALENSWPLITRNIRHFQMIPGLTIFKPY